MLVVSILGGMGNQMYGYALYRALLERGRDVKMDLYEYKHQTSKKLTHRKFELERVFDIKGKYITSIHEFFLNQARKLHIFKPYNDNYREGDFHPEILELENGMLYGYWQSFKYIEGIEDKIRDAFTFRKPLSQRSADLIREIRSCNSVSLSIRRGDYMNIGWNLPAEWYQKAIDYVKKRVPDAKFFVTSDDIEWCKSIWHGNEYKFVDWSLGDDQYFDMQVITECRHNILANSTFCVWGAWLNNNKDRIVIRPPFWNERKDFWPPEWICM